MSVGKEIEQKREKKKIARWQEREQKKGKQEQ